MANFRQTKKHVTVSGTLFLDESYLLLGFMYSMNKDTKVREMSQIT